MKLDTLRGVIHEQGRLYRLWTNGKLKTDDMSKGIGGLREIRSSIEAMPPEPEVYRPSAINIVAVPSGCYVTDTGTGSDYRIERTIDHQVEHQPLLEIETSRATDPAPSEEEARIIDNLKREINELARKAGVDLVV